MSDPSIEAIIVSFESGAVLGSCLDALKAEGILARIVDNASSDDSRQVAGQSGATVIANARNEGFGRAMNIGARASKADYVLLLNPDAVVQPGFGPAMVEAAQRYGDAGILGPRLLGPANEVFFPLRSLLSPYLANERKRRWTPEGDCCAPFLSGACYLIRREFFLSLGGFDPEIFLFYEDNDLCRRVIEAGRSVVYIHAAIVRHAQGRSSAPAEGRVYRTRWHYAWSQGYIARKYGLKSPAPATILQNGLKYAGALLTGNRARAERYGGAAAGALAALRGQSALDHEGLDRSGSP